MKVILKEDVAKLGEMGEMVEVKPGFARNFLIPRGKAMTATPAAKKQLEETIRQREHKEAKLREEAQQLATRLEGLTLSIGAKASNSGKIYGSVNTIQIAEALEGKGFHVERKQITILQEPIKELGRYKAAVKLHRDVTVDVEFEVIAE